MSQEQQILEHLKSGKTLDPMTALREFSCFRLAARINDLRNDGYNVEMTKKRVQNKSGEDCFVAEYSLKEW